MIGPRGRKRILLSLVTAAFLLSGWRVTQRLLRDADPARITLRFSHWQLEPGVRDAFDALCRDYERLHPHVRVEQLLIPENIYRQWSTTQLVGGKAPDLVQRGKGVGVGSTLRYFHPITAEVNLPNPYNAGTTLADVPWRNTFSDGMESGYDLESFECYGASLFTGSVRLYYNVELLRTITGRTEPPASFAELRALCAAVTAFARETGRDVVPIAGSALSGHVLLDGLFSSQTQRLASELNPGVWFPVEIEEFSLAYLAGDWSVDHPAMRRGAELMRAAAALMPPGFMQSGREQANLMFVQGRALMMVGFSVEATGVFRQASFPVRAFRTPVPVPEDPRFGPQVVARDAESGLHSYGGFGITRSSRHPAQALDFLRFLTSEASCRKYTRLSQNLPVITSVEVPPALADFAPDRRGFPPGPMFTNTADVKQLIGGSQHLLFGPEASETVFLERLRPTLGPAMRRDLERNTQFRIAGIRRLETSIASARAQSRWGSDHPDLARKYQSQTEAQNELETYVYYTQLRLRRTAAVQP